MADQAADGGAAPRTRAALADFAVRRDETVHLATASLQCICGSDEARWEAEIGLANVMLNQLRVREQDAARDLAEALEAERVLDRIDALEAERAALLAVVGAARELFDRWGVFTFGWSDNKLARLRYRLDAYERAKGG